MLETSNILFFKPVSTLSPTSRKVGKIEIKIQACAKKLRLRHVLRVRDFGKLLLRPIVPKDEEPMIRFHRALSEETVYKRYFEHINLESRTRHDRLARICTNDDKSFALVAEYRETAEHPAAICAVGRLSKTGSCDAADFAILVQDKAQGRGIGSALMKHLITLARACSFKRLTAEVLVANHEMLYVCRQFGFSLHTLAMDGLVQVSREL